MNFFNLLGIELTIATYDEIIKEVEQTIVSKRKFTFHNINSHILLGASKREDFRRMLQRLDRCFLDGIGVYLAVKLLSFNITALQRITGTDLYYKLIDYAIKNNRKVFFYGVNGLSSERINLNLKSKFPMLNIVGVKSDEGGMESDMIEAINNAAADILFVGLGTPKQEEFVVRNSQFINCPVQVAVGSGIEYLAGIKRRAPKFMQALGLEWLFRLFIEPTRLWRRYLIGIPHFIWLILKQKLNASDKIR